MLYLANWLNLQVHAFLQEQFYKNNEGSNLAKNEEQRKNSRGWDLES